MQLLRTFCVMNKSLSAESPTKAKDWKKKGNNPNIVLLLSEVGTT